MLSPVSLPFLGLFGSGPDSGIVEYPRFRSREMGKAFKVEVWLPKGMKRGACQTCKVLVANDGQDMRAVHLRSTLDQLMTSGKMGPVLVVAVHAKSRMQDYGISHRPDYLGRGGLALGYGKFITRELLPYIQREYKTKTGPANTAIIGFSLGGLSAFDVAWRSPSQFGAVGVFSGSFWWRSKGYKDGYTDADRIAIATVAESARKPDLRFWFQTGTEDESNDRDKDGVIDAIGDTRDLMAALARKGYADSTDMIYYEMLGGRHNQETWGKALPEFLRWWAGR